MAVTLGRTGPGRPAEKRCQLLDFLRVGDDLRDEAVLGGVGAEEVGVVIADLLEGAHLLGGELQRSGGLVVAVGPHHLDDCGGRILHSRVAQLLADMVGRQAKVFGGVVGPEIAAVAHHRPVLLQPAAQEDLLSGGDVLRGVERLAVGADDALRLRHRVGVGPGGQHAHDQEAEHHDQGDALDPAFGDGEFRLARRGLQELVCHGYPFRRHRIHDRSV